MIRVHAASSGPTMHARLKNTSSDVRTQSAQSICNNRNITVSPNATSVFAGRSASTCAQRPLQGPRPAHKKPGFWVFKDVVLQDVGFQDTRLKPSPHTFNFEGPYAIIVEPHILKHRIPELPRFA